MKKKESNDTGVGLLLGLSLGHGVKHFGQSALSVIGPFLKVSLNLSDVAYGAIFSASNVASGLSNIPAGIFSDMYRKTCCCINGFRSKLLACTSIWHFSS